MMFWGLIEPSVHKVIYRSRSEATERRSEAVNASHTVCICALNILRKNKQEIHVKPFYCKLELYKSIICTWYCLH